MSPSWRYQQFSIGSPDTRLSGSLWFVLLLTLYSSPFWTAALWLTHCLLPGHGIGTLTIGVSGAFTATFYALFRILRQHIARLKAARSPDWIVWHLLALLFITTLPAWYTFQALQPACEWLTLSPDAAMIPAMAIAWSLIRNYRLYP